MKNLFFAFAALLAITFTSCGDDGCDSDFTGTYTGTLECGDGSTTEDVEVTITGEDGDYTLNGSEFAGGSLDQDGCTLSYDISAFGAGEEGSITISGGTLTIVRTTKAVLADIECTYIGTK